MVVDSYHSQIDLGPTMLDLIGQPYRGHYIGHSLLAPQEDSLAFTVRPGLYWGVMGKQAWMINRDNQTDYLLGNQEAARKQGELGRAWINTTRWLLQEHLYWPPETTPGN